MAEAARVLPGHQRLKLLASLAGLALSIYALAVEKATKAHAGDGDYQAFCDFSEHVSCSKVFASPYGTGFGLVGPLLGTDSVFAQPNSLYGVAFFSVLFLIEWGLGHRPVVAAMLRLVCITAAIMSAYLAYILSAVLHNFCVVCLCTHAVNAALVMAHLYPAPSRPKTKPQ